MFLPSVFAVSNGLLGSRGIPVHYDLEDYEEDLATLKELGHL